MLAKFSVKKAADRFGRGNSGVDFGLCVLYQHDARPFAQHGLPHGCADDYLSRRFS